MLGPLTLDEIERAVRAAWSRETSDDPDEWTPVNASRGQCGVTALVLRDLLGGEILIANVLRDGVPTVEHHAWNRLASGVEIDLTREQFQNGETLGAAEIREPRARTDGRDRYQLLRDAVVSRLPRCGLTQNPANSA
jgi:hypothetical protein